MDIRQNQYSNDYMNTSRLPKNSGFKLNRIANMSNQNKSTRLGDILVGRGVITRQQLREAIEIQQARQLLKEKNGDTSVPGPLGEILIELGFINHKQLVQTLGWQNRLRKATLVMSFVAPLLTTACGGGGGGTSSPTGNNKPENSSAVSSVMAEQSSSQASFTFSSSVSSSSSAISLSSQSSSAAEIIDGPVLLIWSVPSARENGEELVVEEIGGYELRYKSDNEADFTSVIIDGGHVNSYYFNHLEGNLKFEIAAYDTNGLYSRFVPIQPQPK
jgi:hypothetical protein